MVKSVYKFGNGSAEGGAHMRNLLGGKGANLAEMSSIGLPVPPGFTITTEVCKEFYDVGQKLPDHVHHVIEDALLDMGKTLGLSFGDETKPLLVSVRSGARASMPGMMDTVLNLGLNDKVVEGLAKMTNDSRFAWDTYRRFIQMFGSVVLEIDHDEFEESFDHLKSTLGKYEDTELSAKDLQDLVANYKAIIENVTGESFPQNPQEQLTLAIEAVFRSWHNPRAETYRQMHGIPLDWGTAVNVQSMVFGNLGDDSATGVLFTRDPSTGSNEIYGEFLANAQGEDVVAGIRTPQLLGEAQRIARKDSRPSLECYMPGIWQSVCDVAKKLEQHFKDMQDIEFTIQNGKLWLLQTRNGKRTGSAAVKIAVAMVDEGMIDIKTALHRVDSTLIEQLLHPVLADDSSDKVLCKGLPASPGAASGKIALTASHAEKLAAEGHKSILVRAETNPDDIKGMNAAEGILTARGGMTSHAAVVARGFGKPCITGALGLDIDMRSLQVKIGDAEFKQDDVITIDGASGSVFAGLLKMIQPDLGQDFETFMQWADDHRKIQVRANADTPHDVELAVQYGAEGVGLCRTEHMFFCGDRIQTVRQMIIAEDKSARNNALELIGEMQKNDFGEIFKVLRGKPITIRLLDPPLHEFLPHTEVEIDALAASLGLDFTDVGKRVDRLRESNPMLGHRGCRVGISYPEIYQMQVRAILESATLSDEKVSLEIMIPLVMSGQELSTLRSEIEAVADEVRSKLGSCCDYLVGTMIELPRAALCAEEISKSADFFSFGTNDLTQTTLGLSRDDAAPILASYQSRGILEEDPFVTIDLPGVGALISMACKAGRAGRSDIKLGACGEHAGDHKSIKFFCETGLHYISCSPFRVAAARLSAAQSVC